jgi:hypothetical protein
MKQIKTNQIKLDVKSPKYRNYISVCKKRGKINNKNRKRSKIEKQTTLDNFLE